MVFPFLTITFSVLRKKNVIFCHFNYNPAHLKAFKKKFPGAKWSKGQKAWYVPDSNLSRKRLKIELKEIGSQHESKLSSTKLAAFIRFREALKQGAYSPLTVKTYLGEFAQLLVDLKEQEVDSLTTERLNTYFLHCTKILKLSELQLHSRINAIKSYFKLVLNKAKVIDFVPRPRKSEKPTKVLSKQEIKKLFEVTTNAKHKMMLKLSYCIGLRISEIVDLKTTDIDIKKKQVNIEQAKGKKDRCVKLPLPLPGDLRAYLKKYKPANYLFEGEFQDKYSVRSVQAIFKRAMQKAKINKVVGIHGLRYSYATHLLEAGTDVVFTKKLLGPKKK